MHEDGKMNVYFYFYLEESTLVQLGSLLLAQRSRYAVNNTRPAYVRVRRVETWWWGPSVGS